MNLIFVFYLSPIINNSELNVLLSVATLSSSGTCSHGVNITLSKTDL